MHKKYIIVLLLLLVSGYREVSGNVDSLKSLLLRSEGKQRVPVLISLMERIEREDPSGAIAYGEEGLALLKKSPDKKSEALILCRLGWAFSYKNNLDSAKYFAAMTGNVSREADYKTGEVREALLFARIARIEGLHEEALSYLESAGRINQSAGDAHLEGKIMNEKGSVLRRLARYDEALELHHGALKIFTEFNDDDELRSTLTYLGIISDLKGRYDDALKYHQQALELCKKLSDARGIAATFHNIGVLYQKIGKYDQALEYYQPALDYWKQADNKEGLASTLNSMGAVQELLMNYDKALPYYREALSIWEETGTKYSICVALHNIGNINFYTGNYTEALDYLQRAIDIRRSIGDKNGVAGSLIAIALVYDKLGRKEAAVSTAKEGAQIADETGSWSTIRHAHNILAEIYENNGYYKEALSEYKKFQAAHDSMFNSESQQTIAEMQEKYKSEEQKKQIEILQKDKEIQNLYRTFLIAGVLLLFLFLILLYNRYRYKQRAHHALKKLHESEVESANFRTEAAENKAAVMQVQVEQKTKELNAARELQLSMLPAGIPHHPGLEVAARMITAAEVGGDYYDFCKGEDGSLTIAIGDATGHGVRAGIMVTAIKSLFTLLSVEHDITEILCRATKSIKKMRFKNLFMAFAVLRIKGNLLEYTGAGMPPGYIYRKDSADVEAISLKGLPLGIAAGNEYSKKSIMLNSGDTVLLMSDGFPELFNRSKESYGYDKVPLLLKEAGEKSPEDIINYFNTAAGKWLNGNSQQDDMTFIVFKIK